MKKKAFTIILSLIVLGAMGQTSNSFPASGDANVGATEILNNSYANPLKPGLRSSGDRFLFYNNASYKTAIGMLNENGLYMQAQGGAITPLLQLWSGSDVGGDISAKYTFTIGGNFGIGTANPQAKLHVNGNVKLSANYDGSNNVQFSTAGGMGNTWELYPQENGFGIFDRSNSSWPIFITNDNNVGIGNYIPGPGEKLAVNGKIRAQEVKVEINGWPDYVFAKSYQLPTLQETEKHIKEKGYLPGIPSAAEVKANGIDLGEMNAKLLQKIEELTLHLIDQNKAMEIQNSKLSNQQKLLEKQQQEINELKSKVR